MTDSLHSAGGYVALLSIAWLVGTRRGKIPLRTLAVATGLQVVLTALLLLTGLRGYVFGVVGGLTDLLKATALKANESLLFIGVTNPDFVATYGPMVALEIAAVIVFVASLSRVLYHHGILPWLIGVLSRFVQRVFGISAAESVGVVGNVFLGMTEAPLLIRPYIDRLTLSELFCLMTAGMATIAGTVMVVYASMLSAAHPEIAGHLFTASLISAPAAVAIAKLMMPETDTPATGSEVRIDKDDTINALDAAARGASEGMLLFINILAMLIAFIGLVALVNGVIACLEEALIGADASGTWSLEAMLGWLFRLPVWFMGVSWQEAEVVGSLMGVKTILNEFVAYVQLSSLMADGEQALSERSFLIAVYAMCGFANVGSVAIMIGGIGGIAPSRRGDLARLGLRSVVSGTIATMLTGCVVGVFV